MPKSPHICVLSVILLAGVLDTHEEVKAGYSENQSDHVSSLTKETLHCLANDYRISQILSAEHIRLEHNVPLPISPALSLAATPCLILQQQ